LAGYRFENNFEPSILNHQNNFIGIVKIMSYAAKNLQRAVFS